MIGRWGCDWQRGDQRKEASAYRQKRVRTREAVVEIGGRIDLEDFVLRTWWGSYQLKAEEEARR